MLLEFIFTHIYPYFYIKTPDSWFKEYQKYYPGYVLIDYPFLDCKYHYCYDYNSCFNCNYTAMIDYWYLKPITIEEFLENMQYSELVPSRSLIAEGKFHPFILAKTYLTISQIIRLKYVYLIESFGEFLKSYLIKK